MGERVASMKQMSNGYQNSAGKPEVKRRLGKSGCLYGRILRKWGVRM